MKRGFGKMIGVFTTLILSVVICCASDNEAVTTSGTSLVSTSASELHIRGDSSKKSTKECPVYSDISHGLLFYNRIPKCGSTTMITLLRLLKSRRKRNFQLFSTSREDYNMEKPFKGGTAFSESWKRFSEVLLDASEDRYVYINHMVWPNITKYGYQKPVGTIQMMREPLERYISGYYYNMYGPRQEAAMIQRQKLMMKLTGLDHPPSLDEWVNLVENKPECSYHRFSNKQTRYFCGFHADCEDICSEKAFNRAKFVLENAYDVVGLVSHFRESLQLYEHTFPDYLGGLTEVHDGNKEAQHSRTSKSHPGKIPPSEKTVNVLRAQNRPDIRLYEFARELFFRRLTACKIEREE